MHKCLTVDRLVLSYAQNRKRDCVTGVNCLKSHVIVNMTLPTCQVSDVSHIAKAAFLVSFFTVRITNGR